MPLDNWSPPEAREVTPPREKWQGLEYFKEAHNRLARASSRWDYKEDKFDTPLLEQEYNASNARTIEEFARIILDTEQGVELYRKYME